VKFRTTAVLLGAVAAVSCAESPSASDNLAQSDAPIDNRAALVEDTLPSSDLIEIGSPCEPSCAEKECGDNGCGGSCGQCAPLKICIDNKCPPPGVQCDDGNDIPWDGCTDGQVSEFQIISTSTQQGRFVPTDAVSVDNDTYLVAIQDCPNVAELEDPNRGTGFPNPHFCEWEPESGPDSSGCGSFVVQCKVETGCNEDPIQTNHFSNGNQYGSHLTSTSGGVLAVWTSCPLDSYPWWYPVFCEDDLQQKLAPGQDGSDCGVFARQLALDGTPQSEEVQVNTAAEGYQFLVGTARLADDKLAILYYSDQASAGNLAMRIYSPDLVPLGEEFSPGIRQDSFYGATERGMLTALGDGNLAIVWTSSTDDSNDGAESTQVLAKLVSPSGAAVSENILVSGLSGDGVDEPSISATLDGGFVVLWSGAYHTANFSGDNDVYRTIRGRVFTVEGVPLGEEFVFRDTGASCYNGPLLLSSEGMLFSIWLEYAFVGEVPNKVVWDRFRIRPFLSSFDFGTAAFDVTTFKGGRSLGLNASPLSDGSVVAFWSWTDDEEVYAIHAQRFDRYGFRLYK
jgi:hypothetical protein